MRRLTGGVFGSAVMAIAIVVVAACGGEGVSVGAADGDDAAGESSEPVPESSDEGADEPAETGDAGSADDADSAADDDGDTEGADDGNGDDDAPGDGDGDADQVPGEDDTDPNEGADPAAVLSESMADDVGFDELDAADTLCVGASVVDALGADAALALADDDHVPDSTELDAIVDALYECVPGDGIGSAFGAAMVEGIGPDLPPESADCVAAAYAERDVVESLLHMFAREPDREFEDLDPDERIELMAPLFDCVGLGTIMAAAAADSGVELSSESISCLDDGGGDLIAAFLVYDDFDLAPSEVQQDVLELFFDCLSAEELTNLGN